MVSIGNIKLIKLSAIDVDCKDLPARNSSLISTSYKQNHFVRPVAVVFTTGSRVDEWAKVQKDLGSHLKN